MGLLGLFGPPNVEKLKAKGDVKGLIKALQYQKDPTVRRDAARALGELNDPSAVEPLIAALKDSDKDVRQAAAQALGEIKAVAALIVVLQDSDSSVHQAVIEVLGTIGTPVIEPLIAVLQNSDEEVRHRASQALVTIGNSAVEPLIAVLQDSDMNMCKEAAWALGEIKDPRAVAPLIAVIEGRDYDLSLVATKALGTIGPPAIEPLIAVLQNSDEEVRHRASQALVTIGNSAVEPLIAVLQDSDRNMRKEVTWALGEIKDLRAVGALITMIKDSDVNVGLGKIDSPLITAHRDWKAYGMRDALVKIGAPAVESLIAILQDNDWYVSQTSAWVLGEIKDPRAVDPLIIALRTKYSAVRKAAADALEVLGWKPGQDENAAWYWIAKQNWKQCVALGTMAVVPLIAALKDDDRSVCQAAAQALGEIKDPSSVKPLIAALKDGDRSVCQAAAQALGEIKDPSSVRPLIAALKDGDRSVCKAAAQALGEIKDPSAVAPLIAVLKDGDGNVRQAAAQALGEIKDPSAVEPLIVALKDGDRNVRQAVTKALEKIEASQLAAKSAARGIEKIKDLFDREQLNPAGKEILAIAILYKSSAAPAVWVGPGPNPYGGQELDARYLISKIMPGYQRDGFIPAHLTIHSNTPVAGRQLKDGESRDVSHINQVLAEMLADLLGERDLSNCSALSLSGENMLFEVKFALVVSA